eukprot:TRINITY_DN7871_c0_g1_i1.p1 TRINITY_DN7871_c0_g1~~TRINITY_DN7871_c0_g1_i1.p1  ORF type:complete len:557 (-),score=124.49 TRINITY_DN7871_c0_g1_i1:180-1850(-)
MPTSISETGVTAACSMSALRKRLNGLDTGLSSTSTSSSLKASVRRFASCASVGSTGDDRFGNGSVLPPAKLGNAPPNAAGSVIRRSPRNSCPGPGANSSYASADRPSSGVTIPRLQLSSRASERGKRHSVGAAGGGALSDITNIVPGGPSSSSSKDILAPLQADKGKDKPVTKHGRKAAVAQAHSRPSTSDNFGASLGGSTASKAASIASGSTRGSGVSCGSSSVATTGRLSTSGRLGQTAGSVAPGDRRRLSNGGSSVVRREISPKAAAAMDASREEVCSPFSTKAEAADAQNVSEYVSDVMMLLFKQESRGAPRPAFMDSQAHINTKMRAILVDWLVEVHAKYRLRHDTLFLTVNIIDRYLSVNKRVARNKLQLVGVTALLVASKFEDIKPPQVVDLVYITDNAYSNDEVVQMECAMLGALHFKVVVPNVLQFLEYLQRANCCDAVHREVVKYLLELSLLDVRVSGRPPSQLAAAAVLLSNELLGRRPLWPGAMMKHSRYTETALRQAAGEIRQLLIAAPGASLQAVRKKYSLQVRHGVAKMSALQIRAPEHLN